MSVFAKQCGRFQKLPVQLTLNHFSLENSYIQVRKERDQLVRQNRDSVDSKTGANEEIQKMRSEMELKRKTFEAQFIEYVSQKAPPPYH